MPCNAIAHARSVTNAAFAKGQVPAPYYLFVLMRAQALRKPQAVSAGCVKPGGTVRVQRYTAQHKRVPLANVAPAVPTATRAKWVGKRITRIVGYRNGVPITRTLYVTQRRQVAVLA